MPVIAVTGTAANVAGIVGGFIVFGDPLPGSPIALIVQCFAFVLVLGAAWLMPAPVRAAVGRRRPAAAAAVRLALRAARPALRATSGGTALALRPVRGRMCPVGRTRVPPPASSLAYSLSGSTARQTGKSAPWTPPQAAHPPHRLTALPVCTIAVASRAAIRLYKTAHDWRNGMASTEEAVRTGQSTLQELAKRHLWMHFTRMSAYDDARGPDHRPRRGLLRLGRARQALPRRALGAVLREHRPRPRRRRPGRRRPGQGARVLHELVLRPSAGDRAGRADRLARAGRPQPGVLHQRRQRGGRVRLQARPPVPQAHRQAEQDQADRARDRLPRNEPRRAVGDRHHQPARAVRAAHAGRSPRPQHEHLPDAPGRHRELVRRVDRREDRVRGAGHGRGGDPRARAERRRLLHAARRLLPARARDLRRVRRAADLRRGDLRLGPPRRVVRRRASTATSPT